MKKKGFTLIELLAVIVILAIIAIIAMPIVLNIVEKSRSKVMENNAMGYVEATEKYMFLNTINSTKYKKELKPGEIYQVSDLEFYQEDLEVEEGLLNNIVEVKGAKPKSGIVEIGDKQKVESAILIYDGYKVIYDKDTGYKVEKLSEIDSVPNVVLREIESNGNSITMSVSAEDKVNNIKKITYEINGRTYVEDYNDKSVEVSRKFEDLDLDKEYTIVVTVENKIGRKTVQELKSSTIELGQLRIKLNSEPNDLVNGYYKSETVTFTYDAIAKGYYYKTTIPAKSDIGAVKNCGTDNSPGECTDIDGTINLNSGVWYYFNSIPVITYDEDTTETANIYAAVTTGYKLSATSSAVIDKIDATKPTIEFTNPDLGSTAVTINVSTSDDESGVGSATCNYSIGESTEYDRVGSATTSKCEITGLTPESSLNYKYCVIDGVGNKKCKTGSLTTKVKYTAETHTCIYSNTYTKTSKTCNSYAGNYSCRNYKCVATSYKKYTNSPCWWATYKTTYKCTKYDYMNVKSTIKTCIKNDSNRYVWETSYSNDSFCSSVASCCKTESSFSCNASNEGRSYISGCSSSYDVYWQDQGTTTVSSCTESTSECTTASHAGRTQTSCLSHWQFSGGTTTTEIVSSCQEKDCSYAGDSFISCWPETAGWSNTGSFTSSSNQATSDPSCSGRNDVGNTDVDCSRNYSYSWGSTNTEYDVQACTDNLISCDSSHSGQTYVSCAGGTGEYKFKDSNEVIYDCEVSSNFTCDASTEGQKYITNCTKRSD